MPEDDSEPDTRDDVEDEQPEFEDDDLADVSDVAAEIEDETAPEDDLDPDTDTDDGSDGDNGDSDVPDTTDRGWGDMYVSGLTSGLNAVIDEHGKDGADPVDEALARDLHLDEAMDDWMAKRDRAEMEPEQELLIGTLILSASVIFTKTDLASDVASEVDV